MSDYRFGLRCFEFLFCFPFLFCRFMTLIPHASQLSVFVDHLFVYCVSFGQRMSLNGCLRKAVTSLSSVIRHLSAISCIFWLLSCQSIRLGLDEVS